MTDVLRPSSERLMLFELAGEIDMANAESLGDRLCQAIDLTLGGLVVEMTAVTFIDSSGMAMMLRVHTGVETELHRRLARHPAVPGESTRTHRARKYGKERARRGATG